MTLLEHEEVLLRGRNKCEKQSFYFLSMLTSLHVYILTTICAILFKNYVSMWIIYLIGTIVYIGYVLTQGKKTYQNYNKFFGNDEIVITKEKVYYNVCMNKKGEYINCDSFIYIKDLEAIIVKKGFYPKRVSLIFKKKDETSIEPNEYVNVHCLDNAEEICDYLTCEINKETL